ncbi:MAG: flagellar export chaperone FliS [Gemmatimonadaceae bacterium]|jgi:flagellar protein FliS|nr:flagellar export chaperone FliS [Gemmatimonadaceae bacterium]
MSYATTTNARRGDRYRETAVLSATPGELVILVYDHLLTSLLRGRQAMVANNLDARHTEFSRARDAVAELLGTLDRERGGQVASQLSGLYTFFLRELTTLGVQPDLARLDRVIAMVRDLREAFTAIQQGAVK